MAAPITKEGDKSQIKKSMRGDITSPREENQKKRQMEA